jgi:hypothetical protein
MLLSGNLLESGQIPDTVAASLVASPVRRNGRQDPDGYTQRTEASVRQPVNQEVGDELKWN